MSTPNPWSRVPEPAPSKHGRTRRRTAAGLLLVVAGLVGSAAAAPEDGEIYHTRFRLDGGSGIREAEIEGRIRFSGDAARVEWMEPGSRLLIVTSEDGQVVRFRADPDDQGRPVVRFERDAVRDDETGHAGRWLAATLPVLFRELGHDVQARLDAAYAQGGTPAVLQAIAPIRSDYAAGLHYIAFLKRPGLADQEIAAALAQLGPDLGSDQELANVLYAVKDIYRERPGIRGGFVACFDQFDAPVERSRTARNLFGTDVLDAGDPPVMQVAPGDC